MFFYINMTLSVVSTGLILLTKNYLHAMLYFLLSVIFMAMGIYSIGSPFASMVLIIVYAGAIITLFMFMIMILGLKNSMQNNKPYIPMLMAVILICEFFWFTRNNTAINTEFYNIDYKEIARLLFSKYAVLTEICSVLLVVALVGGFHLGAKHKR